MGQTQHLSLLEQVDFHDLIEIKWQTARCEATWQGVRHYLQGMSDVVAWMGIHGHTAQGTAEELAFLRDIAAERSMMALFDRPAQLQEERDELMEDLHNGIDTDQTAYLLDRNREEQEQCASFTGRGRIYVHKDGLLSVISSEGHFQ